MLERTDRNEVNDGCGKDMDSYKGHRMNANELAHELENAKSISEVARLVKEEAIPMLKQQTNDPVNHPKHYTDHPSGIECIQITEHMGFNLGNALKYIWRCDLKKDAVEDLRKARWYIDREIAKRTK